MQHISEKKKQLRREMKNQRDHMDAQARALASKQICEHLSQSKWFQAAEWIFFYAPIGSEVDLWPLWEKARAQGKHTAFPKVFGEEMRFFEVTDPSQLSEGCFHVLEPDETICDEVTAKGVLVLTPGLLFDEDGNRCGYGRGYYDRYFAKNPQAVRIGVAYEMQVLGSGMIPLDPYDQPLDYIQTQERLIEKKQTYESLVDQISHCRRFGNEPGIVCSREVLKLLGDPQDALSFVHIAGTNGKGSVAAFLNEICLQAGIHTGLFTSPHLYDFNERISIDREPISHRDVVRLLRPVIQASQILVLSRQMSLTMFDYCLALAMLYFREKQVELVVLETGMGGRLDSTNVIQAPVVSVITKIGLEHTQYLGDTIPQIAREKAGILKKGTYAVILRQDEPAEKELARVCEQLAIPYEITQSPQAVDVDTFLYKGQTYQKNGMHGFYQQENATAAISAVYALKRLGFERLSEQAICDGIAQAHWNGRMEKLWDQPYVMIDGAHNPNGVRALADSLHRAYPDETFSFFMGVMADKDYVQMAELILPYARRIYTMTPHSERALQARTLAEELEKKAEENGGNCTVSSIEDIRDLPECFDQERKNIIFGSLYLIGELREFLLEMRMKK